MVGIALRNIVFKAKNNFLEDKKKGFIIKFFSKSAFWLMFRVKKYLSSYFYKIDQLFIWHNFLVTKNIF
jgi:hypothetical protein